MTAYTRGMLTVDVTNDGLDYWSLVLTAATAVATVIAVFAAVSDSRAANKRAAAARKETEELRSQQRRLEADAEAARWADRQAIDIGVSVSIEEFRDMFGTLVVQVTNRSSHPVHDIRAFRLPVGTSPSQADLPHIVEGLRDTLEPGAVHIFRQVGSYVHPPAEHSRDLGVDVLFTDRYGNRWRVTPDHSLLLTSRRGLGVDPEPVNEMGYTVALPSRP